MTRTLVGTPDPSPTSLYADLVAMVRNLTDATGSTEAYEPICALIDRFDEAVRLVARTEGVAAGKLEAFEEVEDKRADIYAEGVDSGHRDGYSQGYAEAEAELRAQVRDAFGPDSDGERWVLMRMAGERVDQLDTQDWLDPSPGGLVHLWADGEPFVVMRRHEFERQLTEAKLVAVEQLLDDTAEDLGLAR